MNAFDLTQKARGSTIRQFIPSWRIGRASRAFNSPFRVVKTGAEANSWVFSCLDRLITGGSSVPWAAFRQGPESVGTGQKASVKHKSWEPDPKNRIAQTIEYPNDHQTRSEQIGFLFSSLGHLGNSLQKVVKVRSEPSELWLMNARGAEPIPAKNGWVSGYSTYTGGSKPEFTRADCVVHAKRHPNLRDPLWGIAPLDALEVPVSLDNAHLEHNLMAVQNGVVPSVVINDPTAETPEDLDMNRQVIEERWSGPINARKPILLAGGAQVQRVSMTPEEADWIASRKFTVTEICAAFGLLAAMFSPDAATFSNQKEAVKYMWFNGIIPLLDILRDAYNLRMVPKGDRSSIWVTYDLSGVDALREDLDLKAKIFERFVSSGVPPHVSAEILELSLHELPKESFFRGKWTPMSKIIEAAGKE